ncbi:two-component system response regulator [Trueperella pecoris]|uniref:two-component system response regulator n=1 Tax=Trueperella pecoris TaxID=2733571 RepID=UPI001ABEE260|nr:two-component system response regulator [Trueperella pecoris]QTG76269.1 two-component system response regulator [Trueperella pecoris]
MAQEVAKTDSFEVMVYSDNRDTRNDVMQAVGRRVGKGLPTINWTEAATWEGAYLKVEENHFDLLILDGETPKLGGIGFGKMVRDELVADMPYIVLIGRPQDEWLARVSAPNAILHLPVDAWALSEAVAAIVKAKAGA